MLPALLHVQWRCWHGQQDNVLLSMWQAQSAPRILNHQFKLESIFPQNRACLDVLLLGAAGMLLEICAGAGALLAARC